jgi:hypothetical protein
MKNRTILGLVAAGAVLACLLFSGFAAAQPVDAGAPAVAASAIGTSPSADDPVAAAGAAWGALSNGNYALGVVLVMVVALGALRRFWARPFETDAGGAWFAFLSTFLVALATALKTGGAIGGSMKVAAMLALGATGGYAVAWKRMLKPLIRWAARKFGWLSLERALS